MDGIIIGWLKLIILKTFQFPAAAAEPPRILRGFEKVSLEAGKEEIVTMTLTPRDFSIFDEALYDWAPIHGVFKLYVGTSSDNLPLSIEVTRSDFRIDMEII